MDLVQHESFICLKPNDINKANEILLNVLASLNIKEKQRGGGDKFDMVATLLIAAMISASTFGLLWASGWVIYILTSATNSDYINAKIYEVCFSQTNISGIKHILKGEIGNIIKTYIHSKNVHSILSHHLREKFGTFDKFIQFCFDYQGDI